MVPLQPSYIAGSKSGFVDYQKPFMTPDDAYQTLENALVYRDRVIERPGLELFGRLKRGFLAQPGGNISVVTGVQANTFNLFTALAIPETNPELSPGNSTKIIVVINGQTLTDNNGAGIMDITPAGNITVATVNYRSGNINFTSTAAFGPVPTTVSFSYYPGLPCTGIALFETGNINQENTLFFDTTYVYTNPSGTFDQFQEYLPGTTWNGDPTGANFFQTCNWIGSDTSQRLLFATNFVSNPTNPMRYTDSASWTLFAPALSATPITDPPNLFLYSALILIPYYGRLLALNTWEGVGVTAPPNLDPGNPNAALNYFSRCRFSQVGSPIEKDASGNIVAWRSDIFGRGGFIDAPTDEAITSAIFHKNTLIVGFERSTWQLRYVGEYGLPFIWERISSDFGCQSAHASILFDEGVLQVGDRAIVAATATNVKRIDEQIPDLVFSFKTDSNDASRIQGVRDFQNELVYWCWINSSLGRANDTYIFPNSTLVYNYRNGTYAIWRNNVTVFGTYQNPTGTLWSDLRAFWRSKKLLWSNVGNPEFPSIVSGNQQGFISYFTDSISTGMQVDEETLSINQIDLTLIPTQITVPNHNLATGEWIRITNALFNVADPGINGNIYNVQYIDNNTLSLYQWSIPQQRFVKLNLSVPGSAIYKGLGQISLYPIMNIISKDFNPYQQNGAQVKLAHIDFLIDSDTSAQYNVNLYVNTNLGESANLITGNKNIEGSYQLCGNIIELNFDVTNIAPCVITSLNHGLRTGADIYIDNVTGTTQINGQNYIVTFLDLDNFIIAVDASTFSPYLGGGDWLVNTPDLFGPGSDYAWHRFFATTTGQFVTYQLTYNNDQMSSFATQYSSLVLNAVCLYTRPGSRTVLGG